MHWLSRILIASLLSVLIAVGLSLLPDMGWRHDMPAFSQSHPKRLSDGNLVDLLADLQLTSTIRNVDWDQSILYVDLGAVQNVDPQTIFRDMYEIAHAALAGTTNVRQVLIRVMDRPRDKTGAPQLVVALDAQREGLPRKEKQEETPAATGQYERYLAEHFRVTYTVKWKEWYAA